MKLFKKIFPVLVLALCAGFSSCEKEDDVTTDPTALIGTWTYASASYNVQTSIPAVTDMLKEQFESNEDMKGAIITFKADGTYSVKSSDGDGIDSGTYSAKNGTLTIYSTDEDGNETATYSIKDSKLTMTNDYDVTEFADMTTLYPELKITKLAISIVFNKK